MDKDQITDFVSDGQNFYFFEKDSNINSPGWIHDTRIMIGNSSMVQKLSSELFMLPTEIHEKENYLYFAVLAEDCFGQVLCDYQDIVRMSKLNGDSRILFQHLKSAVHISLQDDFLYISESSGNIWKARYDGISKELVFKTNNIIMELATDKTTIYWIEEDHQQISYIMTIKDSQDNPKVIDSGTGVPYDLKIIDGELFWNEIYIKATDEGDALPFTKVMKFKEGNDENNPSMLSEFTNTIPLLEEETSIAHHGPYLTVGDFLLVTNNTENDSVIHLLNAKNNTKYDVATISDYDVKYLKNDNHFLYVVGHNDNGFILERFGLPIPIPEFTFVFLYLGMLAGLSLILFMHRFSHITKFT